MTVAVTLAVASLLVATVALTVAVTVARNAPEKPDVDTTRTPAERLASGTLGDTRSKVIGSGRVLLLIHSADGKELSRSEVPVGNRGVFSIGPENIPPLADAQAGLVAGEADNHLAAQVPIRIQKTTDANAAWVITPSKIHLRLRPVNPWLTLLVLIPGIVGLILALLHLTGLSRGIRLTQLYALSAASLWSGVATVIVYIYVQQGNALIPLFWRDLYVSSGVVVFAFLGAFVYVAYSMHEKDPGLIFRGSRRDKLPILLIVGGRILVAPYVALAGYAVFAATFPALNTGAFGSFFGFFSGLFIKPVLEALNDIGLRLLSAEEREKVKAQATRRDVIVEPEVGSIEHLLPNKTFLAAVEQARSELLAYDDVIGVGWGDKLKGGLSTGHLAIVAYVTEKQEVSPDDPQRIPATVAGFPVDVRELPPPPRADSCNPAMLLVAHDKLHQWNEQRLGAGTPLSLPPIQKIGNVWMVVDQSALRYHLALPRERRWFDAEKAYQDVRQTIGDAFDFVAFLLDGASGIQWYEHFCVRVFSDATGLGYERNLRAAWSSKTLRSVQVHSDLPTLRTALHEIVHTWSSYVEVNAASVPPTVLLHPADNFHWQDYFDYDNSCMNESRHVWANGERTDRANDENAAGAFGLCDLDLHLMGLTTLVPDSRLRRYETTPQADGRHREIEPPLLARALPVRKAITPVTKRFRQAWVVVTADASQGKTLADALNAWLPSHQQNFKDACRNQAELLIT